MKKVITVVALSCLSISVAFADSALLVSTQHVVVQCPNPVDGTNTVLLNSINDPSSSFMALYPSLIQSATPPVKYFTTTIQWQSGIGKYIARCEYSSGKGLVTLQIKPNLANAELVPHGLTGSNGPSPATCNTSPTACAFYIGV